jgi:hypothetical protein
MVKLLYMPWFCTSPAQAVTQQWAQQWAASGTQQVGRLASALRGREGGGGLDSSTPKPSSSSSSSSTPSELHTKLQSNKQPPRLRQSTTLILSQYSSGTPAGSPCQAGFEGCCCQTQHAMWGWCALLQTLQSSRCSHTCNTWSCTGQGTVGHLAGAQHIEATTRCRLSTFPPVYRHLPHPRPAALQPWQCCCSPLRVSHSPVLKGCPT